LAQARCIVRQDIGAGISIFDSYLAFLNQIQNKQVLAFFLFMGTSPKDCALLGGKENTLKLKTTAKLNSKQTSIATVRDLYRMYATFLTPFGSHYRLPLTRGLLQIQI
jgi:hypothetical protein